MTKSEDNTYFFNKGVAERLFDKFKDLDAIDFLILHMLYDEMLEDATIHQVAKFARIHKNTADKHLCRLEGRKLLKRNTYGGIRMKIFAIVDEIIDEMMKDDNKGR